MEELRLIEKGINPGRDFGVGSDTEVCDRQNFVLANLGFYLIWVEIDAEKFRWQH